MRAEPRGRAEAAGEYWMNHEKGKLLLRSLDLLPHVASNHAIPHIFLSTSPPREGTKMREK
jgi:hypothetical protein